MCLAIPVKVKEIIDNKAVIEINGIEKKVDATFVKEELKKGDYVLLHAGFIIQVLNEKEAKESLDIWREILSQDELHR